ncbi:MULTISPECIES: 2Fe-2S iron-sulfur cluster-binding protein [unclassified Streptomyces]|uniref:2Fe-2S iron-sulfur cluster-binding protein n=1 Tax=unclassified Streptomyces TaxID=2593676 RepID=UPI0003AA50F9|nr:2Fe-2S iron-sulfur cluster-binding protein [Streptomyces sp. HmicA12]
MTNEYPGPDGWQPLPQGDYDSDATAFVQLPPEGFPDEAPLAAPGHGYVPPQITVSPATGAAATDPAATGVWVLPPELTGIAPQAQGPGGQGHEQSHVQDHGHGHGHGPEGHGQGQGQEVRWPEANQDPYGAGVPQTAHNQPAQPPQSGQTGQWSIPVADGELPDESGEFTASALASQWGDRTPPATLPGGAPAPWASYDWARQPADAEPAPEEAPEPVAPQAVSARAWTQDPQADPAAGEPVAVAPEEPTEPGRDSGQDSVHDSLQGLEQESAPEPATTEGDDRSEQSDQIERLAQTDQPEEAGRFDQPGQIGQTGQTGQVVLPEPSDEPDQADRTDRPGPAYSTGQQDQTDQQNESDRQDRQDQQGQQHEPDQPDQQDQQDQTDQTDQTVLAEVSAPLHDDHPLASYVLRVNGTDRPVTGAWIGESLLYVLRERLGLAGAKDGCSQGECGACNVQVDGRLVASCLVPAATAAGSDVRTVEGLAEDGQPSDVQRALGACGAVQCGFCIPGMAMTVHDLLEGNPDPTELETRQALCGNLCRCSGYRGVLDAVREVAAERKASAKSAAAEQAEDEPRIPHQAGPAQGEHLQDFPDGGQA